MNLDKDKKISCVIIGGGTIPIRCAEILLQKGHELCAIVSTESKVKKWAEDNNILHLVPGEKLAEQIQQPFEYLFSINNKHILREDVLQIPQKLSINYHDAMLPKYAGTHATSWALLNGEKTHGISWHIITDVVDAGDILKQSSVPIDKNDTALTLNTKCYEAAIKAFDELVEDLAADKAVPKKQNLEDRTFFPRFKRPANGGLISWNKTASEISQLVRALNFGEHPNPLGVAKIAIQDEFFIVSKCEILVTNSLSAAGTINKIETDLIQISTADKEIILREIYSIDGQKISIEDLQKGFGLSVGYKLVNLENAVLKEIEKSYKALCKHETFWVNKLSTIEPAVPPFVNSTSASDSSQFENVSFSLKDNLVLTAEKYQNTNEFLFAAFGLFLARLSGIESFDVGYKNSTDQDNFRLKDLFADQVPFHFEINCLQSFEDNFKVFNEETRSVEQHKTYAKDVFMRYPQLRPDLNSDNGLALPVAFANVEKFDDFEPNNGSELTLVISDHSECYMVYDKNRIDADNVSKLAELFNIFLNGIISDPECQIANLPLLTDAEREKILVEWNNDRSEFPKDKCIHQLFEEQVLRTPDKTALVFGNERLSYQELNSRANQVATYLQTLNVGAETLVGICVERSVEMIVGILGILKSGGAYVPLDPAYPKDRLTYMLEDSQASVLLTQKKLVNELDQDQAKIVCLDSDWDEISKQSKENPVSQTGQNNLAYVIYTSGSTGKPKGVAIEHRSAVALLSWANSVYTDEQLKGVLASTSICFDLSVYEMFTPLSNGGSIILVENILYLPGSASANEVTLINTVPSAITELLRIKGVPKSVRTVNLAGEPLKISLVKQIYELEHIKEVFDLYGPSEDTTYSTYTLRDTERATIGRPISNTQAFVLDKYFQPVPVGIPGELYLGGDGLARGYLNRKELTDEKFINDPFNQDTNARLYKTGDLVRYLPTGEIEYLGRIDNQVKIRGFRIELGEIEAKLLAHPSIIEAVVIAREDQPGDKRLAAYFVFENKQSVEINDLREHLKQTLPDYMIPSAFVELDELPLTPNGKIDRKALPVPTSTISDSGKEFIAHRDDIESKLVNIWESILGVNPISVQDNFFELGGHSLQAIRMFAEVEETFDKTIPLATLFEAGTIEKLAEILRQENWAAAESSLVPIQPNGTKPIFFCVHAKGGNVLFYRDLAKHLGEDQPFYGIQARRLGGRQVGHGTVEEMAEFYIKEIKSLQPEGPYFIGGSSFGGLAAFEIAQQLSKQGDEIALLALFDTGTPDYPKMLPNTTALRSKIYSTIRRFQHQKNSLMAFSWKERAEYSLGKVKKVKLKYRRKISQTYKKIVRRFYLKTKGTGSIPTSYIHIEDQIWKAGQIYEPKVYGGDMTLFRASNQPLGIYPDPTLGWKDLVENNLEILEVPGHHGSIVAEPYVRLLAEKLTECIESARTEKKRSAYQEDLVETDNWEYAKAARI